MFSHAACSTSLAAHRSQHRPAQDVVTRRPAAAHAGERAARLGGDGRANGYHHHHVFAGQWCRALTSAPHLARRGREKGFSRRVPQFARPYGNPRHGPEQDVDTRRPAAAWAAEEEATSLGNKSDRAGHLGGEMRRGRCARKRLRYTRSGGGVPNRAAGQACSAVAHARQAQDSHPESADCKHSVRDCATQSLPVR